MWFPTLHRLIHPPQQAESTRMRERQFAESLVFRTGVHEHSEIRPVAHEVGVAYVVLHQPPTDDDHAGAWRPHGDVIYSLHVALRHTHTARMIDDDGWWWGRAGLGGVKVRRGAGYIFLVGAWRKKAQHSESTPSEISSYLSHDLYVNKRFLQSKLISLTPKHSRQRPREANRPPSLYRCFAADAEHHVRGTSLLCSSLPHKPHPYRRYPG